MHCDLRPFMKVAPMSVQVCMCVPGTLRQPVIGNQALWVVGSQIIQVHIVTHISHLAECATCHNAQAECSVWRALFYFRSCGLRHLVVVDRDNRVCGMLTRKDLLKVAAHSDQGSDEGAGGSVGLEVGGGGGAISRAARALTSAESSPSRERFAV